MQKYDMYLAPAGVVGEVSSVENLDELGERLRSGGEQRVGRSHLLEVVSVRDSSAVPVSEEARGLVQPGVDDLIWSRAGRDA